MSLEKLIAWLGTVNRTAVSRATGVPYQTISNIYLGRTLNPKLATVEALWNYKVSLGQ